MLSVDEDGGKDRIKSGAVTKKKGILEYMPPLDFLSVSKRDQKYNRKERALTRPTSPQITGLLGPDTMKKANVRKT